MSLKTIPEIKIPISNDTLDVSQKCFAQFSQFYLRHSFFQRYKILLSVG